VFHFQSFLYHWYYIILEIDSVKLQCVWWCGCSHITTHTVILSSTINALPYDGVTAPKYVGAVSMLILM
jgi:hypothetical protein